MSSFLWASSKGRVPTPGLLHPRPTPPPTLIRAPHPPHHTTPRCRRRYVFAFQVPFIPEAAFCANDFQQIADAFLVPPFGPANAERYFSAEVG